MGTDESPRRPTGRNEVRTAVLRAARKLLSARGTQVSLRDVADAAGVNVGLIHRHIGRKDDLLTAVMSHSLLLGTGVLEGVDDAGSAVRDMLLRATRRPESSRILAWLALDRESVVRPLIDSSARPAAAVRRMRTPPPAGDVELLLAFTALYAWPVLRDDLLDALDIPDAERETIDERLADLVADVVRGRMQT